MDDRRPDRYFADILDAIPDGVYVTDAERRVVFWSEGAARITGYPADEVVGSFCSDDILVHEDPFGRKLCTDGCPLTECIETGEPQNVSEVFLKREDGERLGVYVKTRRFTIDDEVFGVEVFGELESVAGRDVARLIQQLSDSAVTDSLTGLFNRRYIDTILERQFDLFRRLGQHFGVVQIDVDSLKAINDTFGHAAGDEALRFVATVLSDNTRTMDTLARYGGDEFLVVSAVAGGKGLDDLGKRTVQLVASSRFLTPSEETIAVTVSAGGALVHADDQDARQVLERADAATCEAKRAGGGAFRLIP